MREESDKSPPDRRVAAIAACQHAVLTSAELIACGLTTSAIDRRLATGRLHRKHQGVYAVGTPALTQHGVWLAAVKACGPEAVLSHRSAAQLLKLLPLPDQPGPVHITVPGSSGRRSRRGIHLHRSKTLTRTDWMIRDRIPVTNPTRTLTDLRRVLPIDAWEDALDRARFLSLPIGALSVTEPTRSRFERRMLALCRHRLPKPEVNVLVGPYRVDLLWRQRRLIVEADGWENHRDREAFEADRARDAELALAGYRVVRFTWRRVRDEPDAVAATIRTLLAARAA